LAPNDHVLVLAMHHIVADGWSLGVLVRELGAAYSALSGGEPLRLPELPIQYGDFAWWEREQLQGAALEASLGYWQQQLAGAPPALHMPLDRPRPPVQSSRGARYSLALSKSLTNGLHALSRREGVTLFMTLLAAFQALLLKYTAQEDLVVGCVTANRNRAQLEGLIGFFANTLAIRTDLSADPQFAELLRRVAKTTLEAYAHQELPFEKLVEALRPERDLSRTPIVQVVFVLQNAPMPPLALPGLTLEVEELDTRAARFDLLVAVTEFDDGLMVTLEYATDLFDRSTMTQLADHFRTVLEAAVANPTAPISVVTSTVPIQTLTVAVAATFTAEPLEEPLRLCFERLRLPVAVRFAPYNQVFPQLLDPDSLLSRNAAGVNVLLVRPEDWAGNASNGSVADFAGLAKDVNEFGSALERFAGRTRTPCIFAICPGSDELSLGAPAGRVQELTATMIARAKACKGVTVVDLARGVARYRVKRINDMHADDVGHVPYSPGAFAAIAACLARRIWALGSPYRAIVSDCHGTLWSATSPGATDARIDPVHKHAQDLLVRMRAAGLRVCLVGDGSDDEAFGVFRAHPDMPLKPSHLQSWRFNGARIEDKVNSLSVELAVPLTDLIFVSADPVACAALEQGCPDVLTIAFPAAAPDMSGWLEHIWAFPLEDLA
jgi:hypothetical protein